MDSGIRDDDPFDYIFGNYYDSEKNSKPGLEQALLEATRSPGQDSKFMSPDNFHSVINMILKVTALKAGGSVKSFVDVFIYRAIATIKPPEYTTVDAEYGLVGIGVPSSSCDSESSITYTPACIVDYRIVASNTTAQAHLQLLICNLEFLKSSHPLTANKLLEKGIGHLSLQGRSIMPLSVLEPEPKGVNLEDCIPHLAWKMYAAAKTLKYIVEKASAMHDLHTRESCGFGFVTMETAEEADAAIPALNGTELMGKVMNVERACRGRARTPTPGRYYGPLKRTERLYDNRYTREYEDRGRGGGGGGRYDDYRGGGCGSGGSRDYDRHRNNDRDRDHDRGHGGRDYDRARYDDRRY